MTSRAPNTAKSYPAAAKGKSSDDKSKSSDDKSKSSDDKRKSSDDKGKSSKDKRKQEDQRLFPKSRSVTTEVYKVMGSQRKTPEMKKPGVILSDAPADSPCYRKCYLVSSKAYGSQCEDHARKAYYVIRQDSDSQVCATDIQASVAVQTSDTLLLRTAELPQRCPNRIAAVTAHKHPQACECERPHSVSTRQYQHSSAQTEPWQGSSLEHAQTGPSLTAVGPFSRFDYKLRKSKLAKDDAFVSCCRPVDIPKADGCTDKCFLCPNVEQQVCSLDIGISELLQTDDNTEATADTVRVICEKCLHQISRITHTNRALEDCECSYGWNERQTAQKTKETSVQVNYEDISPTKCTQTDMCMWLDVCKKSWLYPKGYWVCGFKPLPQLPCKSVNDFSQQVSATDIGSTKETQTCLQLALAKSFCPDCSRLANDRWGQGASQRVLIGRPGKFGMDRCEACGTAPEVSPALDASTQAKLSETSYSKEQQTIDQTPRVSKCFVRRGQWASKTWH
ncbi:hypothetical protein BsWGS_28790 [Bradybaena similaris]